MVRCDGWIACAIHLERARCREHDARGLGDDALLECTIQASHPWIFGESVLRHRVAQIADERQAGTSRELHTDAGSRCDGESRPEQIRPEAADQLHAARHGAQVPAAPAIRPAEKPRIASGDCKVPSRVEGEAARHRRVRRQCSPRCAALRVGVGARREHVTIPAVLRKKLGEFDGAQGAAAAQRGRKVECDEERAFRHDFSHSKVRAAICRRHFSVENV